VLSGLAILGRSGPKWSRNSTLAAIFVGLAAGGVAAAGGELFQGRSNEEGFVLAAITISVAIWGIIKAKGDGHPATATLIRKLTVTFFAMTVVIAVAKAYTNDAAANPFSLELANRRAIGNALVVSSIVIAVLAAVITAIARVQQANAIEAAARRLDHGRRRLIVAMEASRRLDSAIRQWSWTGTSLNYLIQYPFGQAERSTRSDADIDELGLLRFQILALEFGEDGRRALLAGRLRASTTAGWLLRQYDRAAETFATREARLHGLPPSSACDFMPDEDEDPLSSATSIEVQERSPRVAFARWLNSGACDESLVSTIMDEDLVDVYRTILGQEDNYDLRMLSGPTGARTDSLQDVFAGVVPAVPRLIDPGLVTRLFSGANSGQEMTSEVWWPDDLTVSPHPRQNFIETHCSVPFTTGTGSERIVLQAVRFDRSQSFAFHELAGTEMRQSMSIDLPDEEM